MKDGYYWATIKHTGAREIVEISPGDCVARMAEEQILGLDQIENVVPVAPEAHSRLSADTLDDEDPDVMIAARAIAEHGFGRNWDDFHSCDASQTDQGDLIEYGRAAVTALRSRVLPQALPVPIAWRSRQAGSKFWQVHVNDPTEAVEKYATVSYEIAPLFACSTCGGSGKVKSKNPERDKAWEVPCPSCSLPRPHGNSEAAR